MVKIKTYFIHGVTFGFPYVGFHYFGEIRRGDYDRYKMYDVDKFTVNNRAFYLHYN